MAATSDSEEELTSKELVTSRRDSSGRSTKRARLSTPKRPKAPLPVEIIELSSGEDTPVFKSTGKNKTPATRTTTIQLHSDRDIDIDELEGEEEEEAEEASVEKLVRG